MLISRFCAILLAAAIGTAADRVPVEPFESAANVAPAGRIDEPVFARWKSAGVQPANLCSDAVFVRRVYLDATGTLPTGQEAAAFIQDRDPNKRAALIDRLLASEEFADYWTLKWSDLLRVKAEFPINLWPNAAQAYSHWIHASVRDNIPYNRFVREMLVASGSNFRDPAVNFYRAMQSREPEAIAQTVALTFMGARAEKWPKQRLAGMAGFFSEIGFKETGEWKEEIIFFDPAKAAARKAVPVFPDGIHPRLDRDHDPRETFAAWLTAPGNPWLSRAVVNRVWSWLVGRGIVQEPDDIRPDNPPSNPELLAYLEKELVAAHYDLKHIYRSILNSNTYQLSSIPACDREKGESLFAFYPIRRLDAEVLIDALCQITGTTEKYTSMIPEPYTVVPDGERSIRLPDGSISSAFLELFGRPPRDTGLESERNNRPSAGQRLHLLNSSHVQGKLAQSPRLNQLMRNAKTPQAAITAVYLMVLSRFPTAEERKCIGEHSQKGVSKGRDAIIDLVWALINSPEFLYRH